MYFISCVELHIQRHLVISAPSCVEFLSRLTDPLCEHCLHEAVDVLIFIRDLKPSLFYIIQDPLQTFHDLILVCVCQDPLLCKHHHMRDAASYILGIQPFIKGNRGIEIIYKLIRLLCEASAP